MTVETRTWLERYAAALGAEPPSPDEVEVLLLLASVAAHASERTAAPTSCYLVARSGVDLSEALAVANRLADQLSEAEQS
jgi:Domain of unknown function (DUF6457)